MKPVGGFIWALASLALAAAIAVGLRSLPGLNPFRLEAVRIAGLSRTSPEALREVLDLQTGSNLFAIEVEQLRRAAEQLPWVRSCRVSRLLPSTLQVEVQEWTPRCLVRLDRLYYLAAEGHVIQAALTEGVDYPVVTGLSWADIEGNDLLQARVLEVLDLLDAGLLTVEVGEIHVDATAGFTFYSGDDGGLGIRLGFDDLQEKLDLLARLRRQLKRRGQAAYAVNLSYTDKIIARLAEAGGKDPRP